MFTEINWPSLIQVDTTELIICTTVLQELDKKKFSEQDIDIRNRCKLIISKLSEYEDNPIINDKVSITFLHNEPNIDWDKDALSPLIPDDRILASILESFDTNDSILITSDLGLRLKAKTRSISVFSLPDDLLISIKKNKYEEENQKLRKKISEIESTYPKIGFHLSSSGDLNTFVKYEYCPIPVYNPDKVEKEIKDLQSLLVYDKPIQQENSFYAAINKFSSPSDDEIERYKKDVHDYYCNLRKYDQNYWSYKDRCSRTFPLNLIISNTGTEPAKEIDIHLHFPDGFQMFNDGDKPIEPKKPNLPEKPRNLMQIINRASVISIPDYLATPIGHGNQIPRNMSSIDIKKTHSYDINLSIKQLKHTTSIDLNPIYIYFESMELIKSFSFTYKIIASNYPSAIEGTMNVVFNKKSV
jgi:hypothetical protein